MPERSEDATSTKPGAEAAASREGEGQASAGQKSAEKVASQSAPPVGLDAAFKTLIATLLHKQLNSIKLELRELSAAQAGAGGAPSAGSNIPSSGVAALLGETSPGGGAGGEDVLRSIKSQLDKLEKQLGSPGGNANGGAAGGEDLAKALDELAKGQSSLGRQVVEQVVQHLQKDLVTIAKHVVEFRQTVDGRMARLEESLAHGAAPVAAAPAPVAMVPTPSFAPMDADEDEWKEAILGPDLCQDPSLGEARTRLFRGVLSGDSAAKSLAGQMMLAQAASVDRLAPLMKEVGEAYYRWRPKTAGVNDPFEKALAAWLMRRCDAEGLGNKIELVIVGDRFDATRHNATERGAEISAVQGWVVLRDNGKVYTKANVSVK